MGREGEGPFLRGESLSLLAYIDGDSSMFLQESRGRTLRLYLGAGYSNPLSEHWKKQSMRDTNK